MAESLEQAYELNQKKRNCIIGGMLWLKMGNRMVPTAIDLSNLGLNTIEENEEEFSIGCMTTLRQLEQHEEMCIRDSTDGFGPKRSCRFVTALKLHTQFSHIQTGRNFILH